jgi:hypothetical protein
MMAHISPSTSLDVMGNGEPMQDKVKVMVWILWWAGLPCVSSQVVYAQLQGSVSQIGYSGGDPPTPHLLS